MPAYFRSTVKDFLATPDSSILAQLQSEYARDGFLAQYTSSTIAWIQTLKHLRKQLTALITTHAGSSTWVVLLEYPIYRLRRRIDAVVLTPQSVIVIELKTGAKTFESVDKRQAVEYAQNLRDFHAASASSTLLPVLWAIEADEAASVLKPVYGEPGVGPLTLVGSRGLSDVLSILGGALAFTSEADAESHGATWDNAAYRPVPSVVEAALALFSGHGVKEITSADADNLSAATAAVFRAIEQARQSGSHSVVFLAGVPGSGKTLAGLNIVHSAERHGLGSARDVVYLSGNTPLVLVLREALAQDRHRRNTSDGIESTIAETRSATRGSIQHVNDFLKEYVRIGSTAPTGHVIVFDEAQRAWNAEQGREKFGRSASEPQLLLETMGRLANWSATVCLIGSGQEIHDGEQGLSGWAEAIEALSQSGVDRWIVHAPPDLFAGPRSSQSLGQLDSRVRCFTTPDLSLQVAMRSFRSPRLGDWIGTLLKGDPLAAAEAKRHLKFPIYVTRSLSHAKAWLRHVTRGHRRMGLLASSGARRLRADGLGEVLRATDGMAIAHWYLKPLGDIRSSMALEVPANEYTSQGLELDFAALCWGGDLVFRDGLWTARRLSGNSWSNLSNETSIQFVVNSYRVLLSRAREGLVIWVPTGDDSDLTRLPRDLDGVADVLARSGCVDLDKVGFLAGSTLTTSA